MSTKTHRIFVYGSLKRGYGLHDMAVERGATFEREAMLNDYTIFSTKHRGHIDGIGFLVPMHGRYVTGDVLVVPECIIGWMDQIEHAYTRTLVTLDDGSSAETYISRMSAERHEDWGEVDIGPVWQIKRMIEENTRWKKQRARDQAAYDKAHGKK